MHVSVHVCDVYSLMSTHTYPFVCLFDTGSYIALAALNSPIDKTVHKRVLSLPLSGTLYLWV